MEVLGLLLFFIALFAFLAIIRVDTRSAREEMVALLIAAIVADIILQFIPK
jgi:hypothetical protein